LAGGADLTAVWLAEGVAGFFAATGLTAGSPAEARSLAMTDCKALSPVDPVVLDSEGLVAPTFAAGFAGDLAEPFVAGLAGAFVDSLDAAFAAVGFTAGALAGLLAGALVTAFAAAGFTAGVVAGAETGFAFDEAGLAAEALGEVAFFVLFVLLFDTFFTTAIRYAPSR